jgi:hypothetical protein
MINFWALSDSEIHNAMQHSYDECVPDDPICSAFWWISRLRKMGDMLIECDWDRTLMRLRYSDELTTLNRMRIFHWSTKDDQHLGG